SYLHIKQRQRARSWPGACDPAEGTGKSIDVTKLNPTLEDLRRDYLAARQPTRGIFFHRNLFELTRRRVARLAYFQDKESEENAQRHCL
ncbi:MAG: hypothetical protein NTW03_20735, partial [Verrucomicrobia bacterium]|nr:hypothetical protein [Verrucomicrobiota bacterium]